MRTEGELDLLLSSGFLAFARHVGVIAAIEGAGVRIGAVTGTSSGALIGALYCAGWSASQMVERLAPFRPIELMRPSFRPWVGLCSLSAFEQKLRQWLPQDFSELRQPLAVGVAALDGSHHLLHSGPLPEAVAASCAVPVVFEPVSVLGQRYRDGGSKDRLALAAHRSLRGDGPRIVHLVDRSMGAADGDAPDASVLIRTPRSGASFLSLGDFRGHVDHARTLAEQQLRHWKGGAATSTTVS